MITPTTEYELEVMKEVQTEQAKYTQQQLLELQHAMLSLIRTYNADEKLSADVRSQLIEDVFVHNTPLAEVLTQQSIEATSNVEQLLQYEVEVDTDEDEELDYNDDDDVFINDPLTEDDESPFKGVAVVGKGDLIDILKDSGLINLFKTEDQSIAESIKQSLKNPTTKDSPYVDDLSDVTGEHTEETEEIDVQVCMCGKCKGENVVYIKDVVPENLDELKAVIEPFVENFADFITQKKNDVITNALQKTLKTISKVAEKNNGELPKIKSQQELFDLLSKFTKE